MYAGIAGAAIMWYFDDTWIQTLTPLEKIPQEGRWLIELAGGFVLGTALGAKFGVTAS